MKEHMTHTPEAAAFTELVLALFRLNGQLLSAGDRLTKELGLTSARWQVLGAVDLAGRPLSVSQIARRMGLSRQSVQRIANDLEALEFVAFKSNPDHARAKLVVPTAKARTALSRIKVVQTEWSNALTAGMDAARLTDATALLGELQFRCDENERPTD
jgi:DNA-binding MarR family transcriptional regulator